MKLRLIAMASLVAAAALASGCEEDRVVHDRPLVIERPVQREYVEVVAPRPPPPRIEEVEHTRPGYFWVRGYWRWNGHDYVAVRGHWEPVRPGSLRAPALGGAPRRLALARRHLDHRLSARAARTRPEQASPTPRHARRGRSGGRAAAATCCAAASVGGATY